MGAEKKRTRRRHLVWLLPLLLLMLLAFDCRMAVRSYSIDAAGAAEPLRLVLVADLHSCGYGEGQQRLIEAVHAQSPDVVLLAGDIFDDDMPDANSRDFLAGIAGSYPCYYVTGNHECWSGTEAFASKMAILEDCGVERLSGEAVQLNGVYICGVDDPAVQEIDPAAPSFEQQLDAAAAASGEGFSILLSHRPERFESYAERGFDLVLCGHAHGGQWRIPGLLNGLFAPNQGLFPDYAGGFYEQDGMGMIVSRGLARESTRVPRIFNRPELVVIEVR